MNYYKSNCAISSAVQYVDLEDNSNDPAIQKRRECIKLLLAEGAKIDVESFWALRIAARRGNLYFLKLHVNSIDPDSVTVMLAEAIKGKHLEVISYLTDKFRGYISPRYRHGLSNLLEIYKDNKELGAKIYDAFSKDDKGFKFFSEDLITLLPDFNLVKWLIEKYQISIQWNLISAVLKLENNNSMLEYCKEHTKFAELNLGEIQLNQVLSNTDFLKCLIQEHKVKVTRSVLSNAVEKNPDVVPFLLGHFDIMSLGDASYEIVLEAAEENNYVLVKLLLAQGAACIGKQDAEMPNNLRAFLRAYAAVVYPDKRHLLHQQLKILSPEERTDLLVLFQGDNEKINCITSHIYQLEPQQPMLINELDEGQHPEGEINRVELPDVNPNIEGISVPGGLAIPSSYAHIQQLMPASAQLQEEKENVSSDGESDEEVAENHNVIDAEADLKTAYSLFNKSRLHHFWGDKEGRKIAADLQKYLRRKVPALKDIIQEDIHPRVAALK